MHLVICIDFAYNISNLKCAITLVNFEPTFTLNGIPTLPCGCQASTRKRIAGEGKSMVAVTHLALLGVRRQEPAFWDITEEKEQPGSCSFCQVKNPAVSSGRGNRGIGLRSFFDENDKELRMRMKMILCIVGIVLLFAVACIALPVLDIGGNKSRNEKEDVLEPIVEELHNIYITEVTDTEIRIFDGEERTFYWQEGGVRADRSAVGQIADLWVCDGFVTELLVKDGEKINDKVVGVDAGNAVELENRGRIFFAENVKFYMLYGEMRRGTEKDLRIGYNFADYVLEDGKICAVLLTRDETMEYIRVQIKNSDYAGTFHANVSFTCDTDCLIRYESKGSMVEEVHKAGEEINVTPDSIYFSAGAERMYIAPAVLTGKITLTSVHRSQGQPAYRGTMEICVTDDGLVVINELLLEEYLYAVVPSEMPAGYPLEALKAQAVCARTYAYSYMLSPGLPGVGAHVDDSTGYQVYNNILEQNATTTAVRETAGQLLYADGALVNTYYYSTSCGFGSDEHVWKSETAPEIPCILSQSISKDGMEGKESVYTAENMCREEVFAKFLESPPETDFEKNEPWYRWTYTVEELDASRILEVLKSRYAVNAKLILTLKNGEYVSEPVEKLGKIKKITVLSRNAGGVADELLIEGEKNAYKVISELNIRYVLCDGITQAVRQDGSGVDMKTLLPSAYFVISPVQKGEHVVGYTLSGGGFGHGAGMSQNGAKNMAEAGYTAEQILNFFYKGSMIVSASD